MFFLTTTITTTTTKFLKGTSELGGIEFSQVYIGWVVTVLL